MPQRRHCTLLSLLLLTLPLLVTVSRGHLLTLAVVSTRTPEVLRTSLRRISADTLLVQQISDISALSQLAAESTAIFDCLYTRFWSEFLRDTISHGVILNGNDYEIPGSMRVWRTEVEQFAAVLHLAVCLGVRSAAVFEKDDSRIIHEEWGDLDANVFAISDETPPATLESLLAKQVKQLGSTAVLVSLGPDSSLALAKAMLATGTNHNLVAMIVHPESALWLVESQGAAPELGSLRVVYVVEKDCCKAVTPAEYLKCVLLQRVKSQLNSDTVYSVVEVVEGTPMVVGEIAGRRVTIMQEVMAMRANKATVLESKLVVSYNNGTLNPSGDGGTSEPFDFIGVQIGITDINLDSEVLPHHTLSIFNLSLGLFEFDEDWTKQQLVPYARSDLGVAMITGMYSSITIGAYSILSSLNISIPQVGATNTLPVLSSKREFPLYTRIAMSDAYLSVLYGRMLQHYGWTNIVMLYCDDPWSTGLYNLTLAEGKRLGITVRNSEKLRLLPTEMTSNYTDYLEVYNEVVATKVRIVIMLLFGQTLYKSIEALYDLGMRQGDLFFLATEWLDPSLFEIEDLTLRMKIKELCHGAVQFNPSTTVGAIGAKFIHEYKDLIHRDSSFYSCFYYDSAYQIAHALDYLLASGKDYESAATLNKAIRGTRFKGCTGIVTITEGSNDRFPMMYDVLNSQVATDGSYKISRVGTYDPAGLILFNFTSPVIWPDNTTTVPSDIRTFDIDCPFQHRSIVLFVPGLVVSFVCLFTLALLSVIITAVIWAKHWGMARCKPTLRAEVSFDDYIVFATIWLEAVQHAAMGPDFPSWTRTLADISDSVSVKMERMVKLSHGVFWVVLESALAGVGVWGGLLGIVGLKLDVKWGFLCGRVGDLGEKVLPILGNLCFLPIVSTLLNVFQCLEAVNDGSPLEIRSTFLQQDCYQRCWTSPHLPYAIVSGLALFLYLPLAVLLRPAWQNMQPYLHIFTAPGFLMLKTIYQLLIIMLNKTLKPVHSISHAFVFLSLTLLFFIATLKWKPFGYSRTNLWHSLSLVCVIWLSVLTILDMLIVDLAVAVWLGLFFTGIALVVVAGMVFQAAKLPALLYRKPGIHVMTLFRFMFSRGNKYLYIFSQTDHLDHHWYLR